MARLTLYSTSGCHLCELAHSLVETFLAARNISPGLLRVVEIVEDPELMDRYGTAIPVLRNDVSAEEVAWPFTAEDVSNLLNSIAQATYATTH